MPPCDRCGAHVSPDFYRVWSVDGELAGCPECVPRSVRFDGDAAAFDGEEFDRAKHNAGKVYGGIKADDDETAPTR